MRIEEMRIEEMEEMPGGDARRCGTR